MIKQGKYKLQETVSSRNSQKRKLIRVPLAITMILIAVFSVILVSLIAAKKSNKIFEEKKYYFVSATSSLKESELTNSQKRLQESGGAGIIAKKSDKYYLIVNVYLNKQDAENVCKNIKKTYASAEIIEFKSSVPINNKQLQIKKDQSIVQMIKFYDEFVDFYLSYELEFLAGLVSDTKFNSVLLSNKIEIEEKLKSIKNEENELKNNIKLVLNMTLIHLNNFFSSVFESSLKSSMVCGLGVNLALERLELYNIL